ncbi:hypothetical protein HG537_0D00100 [Torulaspora globosa]|uniref:DEAD/DEAH box helicase domain-containing protein n=1 Tax=Torulaspora globosa TaxID=48254 RepID=A0A7H9HUH7_9SACH|nr:hypothetical protein HG537_0D00100 [Torulaspora sp. CBS 2947]
MDIQNVALRSDVTRQAVSRTALQTYLFLDSSVGDFIKYSMFRKFLLKFPQGDRNKLTFRELRQAMKAVIYYADAHVSTALPDSMASEVMAGHSAKTGLTVYGMDDWSLAHVSGTTATVLQERASERWISWLGLEKMLPWKSEGSNGNSNGDDAVEIAEDVEETVVENTESNRPVNNSWPFKARPTEFRDPGDLFIAGRNLFGPDFHFRDSKQESPCMEIYMYQRPSLIVHAGPGYGKTELFQLPLAALASKTTCKYVSFVFVPYTVLLTACIARLQEATVCRCQTLKIS